MAETKNKMVVYGNDIDNVIEAAKILNIKRFASEEIVNTETRLKIWYEIFCENHSGINKNTSITNPHTFAISINEERRLCGYCWLDWYKEKYWSHEFISADEVVARYHQIEVSQSQLTDFLT